MNKRNLFLLFSPILVIVIMCLCYAFYGIFPFGSKTAAWCDLDQQTIPLLMNFKDILDGKTSILYTAETGGGMNFWGVFFFFLASPFYLAVKFIPKSDMSYFVTVLLILKMAVCAFTSSLYFSAAFKELKKIYIVFFGLVYAFCGYVLMYYQTLVWLDIMYIFPLLVLSADKMCRGNNCVFYIVILSAAAAVNYYLSYMIAVYLLISVPLYIFIRCPKNERKPASMRFLLSSLTSALITAPVWLCSFLQTAKSARSTSNAVKFIFDSPFESLKDKLCVIITCAFIFSALIFIIKSPLLKKKRVKYNLILLMLLMIPVFLDPINKVWHFGGYQGFPLRFGYMITFTALTVICDIFTEIPDIRKSSPVYCALSFAILAIFMFAAVYVTLNKKNTLSYYFIYLGISDSFFKTLFSVFIFAFSVYTLFFILLRKKLISGNIFFILISGVFLTEIFVNTSAYIGYSLENDRLFENTVSMENTINENDLYRVKNEKKYFHVNMIGALGLNSYAHYTSLNSEKYLYAMKKLGYSSYWMETGSNGGTVLTDALLGIKYSIGLEADFNSYQKTFHADSPYAAAENQLCVPAGVILDLPPENMSELNYTDRFDIQRQLSQRFFDSDDLLEKYDFSNVTNGLFRRQDNRYEITAAEPDKARCRVFYNIKVNGHKTLYLDLFDELNNNVTEQFYNSLRVTVNGTTVNESYPDKKNNGFLLLGEFENEEANITLTLLKDIHVRSFGVFGIDINKLENKINTLKTSEPVLKGNKINVSCNTEKNSSLYLAIPWDSGFTAYLNGKKTELYRVNDCFCSVRLDEGQNDLEMIFYPDGFKISLLLTASGIALFVFICFKGNKIYRSKKAGTVSAVICRYAFWITLTIVYFAPVVIYAAGLIIRYSI